MITAFLFWVALPAAILIVAIIVDSYDDMGLMNAAMTFAMGFWLTMPFIWLAVHAQTPWEEMHVEAKIEPYKVVDFQTGFVILDNNGKSIWRETSIDGYKKVDKVSHIEVRAARGLGIDYVKSAIVFKDD